MQMSLVMCSFLNVLFPKPVRKIIILSFHLLSLSGHCDCAAQQQQWFLFDPLHAYAEYIIEYEYLFSVSYNRFDIY